MATYTAKGTYFDAGVTAESKKNIEKYKKQWEEAAAEGDEAGMALAHENAELERLKYGYSGGEDGSERIVDTTGPSFIIGGSGLADYGGLAVAPEKETKSKAVATDATKVSAEEYIRDMYAAKEEANRAALRTAYDANVLTLEAEAAKIPLNYGAARNATAGDYEVRKAALNEYAAGNGLGSGAGTQARLSIDNAALGALTTLHRAEAQDKSEVELERAKLDAKYRNDIAAAAMDGNFELAKALLNDFVN
ncbi:MAG: hypothetical protein LBN30_04325 [Oscillospiraceae bacterium]|jgi:hypothetical protein|nr:hypothetical protein [Oscillospiraceae bacterium]